MPQEPLEAPIPSLTGNPNGLPFSDEMYDKLKFVIEKLSGRMKSEAALSWDDLDRFRAAVDHIILDANIPNVAYVRRINDGFTDASGGQAAPPTHSAQVRRQESRPSRPQSPQARFDDPDADEIMSENRLAPGEKRGAGEEIPGWMEDIAGVKSTWNVPGMQSMSTEEYYQSINQRITDMKVKRKEMGVYDPEPGRSYLDSLNKRNRSS